MLSIYMCQLFGYKRMNYGKYFDRIAASFHAIKLIWNKWAWRIQCLVFSCRDELWRAVNSCCSLRHPKFLVCRLRSSLFMETPTEDLCQESVSRRAQSHECGRVLTPLLRFLNARLHARLPSVTRSLHRLLLIQR